jgi:hypothetical protein
MIPMKFKLNAVYFLICELHLGGLKFSGRQSVLSTVLDPYWDWVSAGERRIGAPYTIVTVSMRNLSA